MEKIKEKREKARGELDNKKADLLDNWKKQWKATSGNDDLDYFFVLFPDVYKYVLHSKNDNKKKNDTYKKLFLFILLAGGAVYFILFMKNLCKGNNKFLLLVENGMFLILLLFFSSLVSKWIDIKKYQETWVRHSWHLHMMEAEMLRFISNIGSYGKNADKKMLFAKRILKIWDKNEEKFVHNMEDKEKELTDIYSMIRGKR